MNKQGKVREKLSYWPVACHPAGLMSMIIYLCASLTLSDLPALARARNAVNNDTSVVGAIRLQLARHHQGPFNQSVLRFYRQNGFHLQWIAPDTVKTHAPEAMLLLDCVLQYGLNYADYHPPGLTYVQLDLLTRNFSKQNNFDKADFDIKLSEALLTYINHLHYGKLNPFFSASAIDRGQVTGFDAISTLNQAIRQKSGAFTNIILSVQPPGQVYKNLQYHMHLLSALYTGDCYDIPDSSLRKMGINLERIRWTNNRLKTYLEVNLASSTLTFYTPDSSYKFKAAVRQSGTASKQTVSKYLLKHFTRVASRLTLDFSAANKLALPGNAEPELQAQWPRAYSSGSISVQKAETLIRLILKYTMGANQATIEKIATNYQNKTITLKKPLPFIVTYRTCEVAGGAVMNYPDIYKLDKALEMALYQTGGQ